MRKIHTEAAPAPGGHYSQAVIVGDTVYTAGQVGLDPTTGKKAETFSGEVRQSLSNLRSVLASEGLGLHNVVRTMCLLTDETDFAEFNQIYAEVFGDHRPARSTFTVRLAGGFRFEIEAIAAR